MANEVHGLTLAKINGVFHVDVKNARWSDKRTVQQHVSGAGIRQAVGEEIPSGSFDEVIPREKKFNWRKLRNFSIEIYDKDTQSIILAAFEGCNWDGIDGTSDNSQANVGRAVTWKGSTIPEI